MLGRPFSDHIKSYMKNERESYKVRFWLEPEPGSITPSRVALPTTRGIGRVWRQTERPGSPGFVPNSKQTGRERSGRVLQGGGADRFLYPIFEDPVNQT